MILGDLYYFEGTFGSWTLFLNKLEGTFGSRALFPKKCEDTVPQEAMGSPNFFLRGFLLGFLLRIF